jgi:hypothetical protein
MQPTHSSSGSASPRLRCSCAKVCHRDPRVSSSRAHATTRRQPPSVRRLVFVVAQYLLMLNRHTMRRRQTLTTTLTCFFIGCGGHSASQAHSSGGSSEASGASGAVASASGASGGLSESGSSGSQSPSGSGADPVPRCVPGQSIGCSCVNGESGAQICGADGTYGACACTGDAGPTLQQVLAQLRAGVVGTWIGTETSPWGNGTPCPTTIRFGADGNYSAHSPGESCIVFYYGSNDDSPVKTYLIDNVTAASEGTGEIVFFFSPTDTNPGTLRHIVLSADGNHLAFEAWKGGYGPLRFSLTRVQGDAGVAMSATDASPVAPVNCPCTRRSGAGTSFMCPAGAGQSQAMTIGTAGGKVTLAGQEATQTGVPFSLTIPPGALASDTMITVTETSVSPPADFVDYSPIYLVQPAALTTTVALPIVIGWANKSGLSAGGPSAPLAIYAAPDVAGPFTRLPDSYVNAGFMQGSIKAFGAFFSGYPKQPAQAGCP